MVLGGVVNEEKTTEEVCLEDKQWIIDSTQSLMPSLRVSTRHSNIHDVNVLNGTEVQALTRCRGLRSTAVQLIDLEWRYTNDVSHILIIMIYPKLFGIYYKNNCFAMMRNTFEKTRFHSGIIRCHESESLRSCLAG